jgi:regulator of sigma E protease
MLVVIIGVVLMLGVSIFIHELGHLLCGMMVGVKARIFSIGYGKGIWKKKINGTTYQITSIPLGGYVMFMGDQYSKRLKGKPGELLSTPPLKRIWPVLGGPLFNLIMGFIIFFFLALQGDDSPSNTIFIDDTISKYAPAYRAGLRSGDTILSVNGEKVQNFEEISTAIVLSAGEQVVIEYERGGEVFTKSIMPDMYSAGGRPSIGIEPAGERNIQVTFKYSEQFRHWLKKNFSNSGVAETEEELKKKIIPKNASTQGFYPKAIEYLKDGDVILDVEGKPVSTVGQLQMVLGEYQGQIVNIKLLRKKYPLLSPWAEEETTVKVPVREAFVIDFSSLKDSDYKAFSVRHFSLAGYDPEISKKLKNIKVDGKQFTQFSELVAYLRPTSSDALRGGDSVMAKNSDTPTKVKLHVGNLEYSAKVKVRPIGILGFIPDMKYNWSSTPVKPGVVGAFKIAADKVYQSVSLSFKAIGMLFSGLLSPRESLSGPIGIAHIAGITISYGWYMYFDFVAKISIALMFMNLLPIPIADGGHIVLYLYEAIAGRPMPGKVIMALFRLGFVFLLLVGALVSLNDIARLFR